MSNIDNINNIDPLEELLQQHRKAMNIEQPSPNENTNSSSVVPSPIAPHENIPTMNIVEQDPPSNEVDYGDSDLEKDIAEEDTIRQEQLRIVAEEKSAKLAEARKNNVFMPPDEHDMEYHKEAIGYQGEKLTIVNNMVNRVIAKYRIISGEVPLNPIPELGIPGRHAVMGELVDIYQNSGDKITSEFETMLLKNWVMPDGTLAINNINENGIVVDNTMVVSNKQNTTVSKNEIDNDENNESKPEVPTVNITVKENTPVTINVDESIIAKTNKTHEVNILVKEVSEKELMKSTIIENSEDTSIIKPYDPGINDVPVTLPLSGYRCVIRGINWYDFVKLASPSSNNNSDAEIKRWSVIYKHIKSPSIGEFKDFEDFLKKTKYEDRELLMWALLVATADDEETLSIKCGNPNCGKTIQITYQPRTITHIDPSLNPPWFFDAANAAVGEQAVEVWERANKRRMKYKLPTTGIIVEINEPSAHEFITKKIPFINELYSKYDENGKLNQDAMSKAEMAEFDYLVANALYISAFIIIKQDSDGNMKEYRFTNWPQIEQIITTALDANDSGILIKLIEKIRSKSSPVSFRVENITCPSCKHHEDYIPINDIAHTLLFQVSQRLSNTQINLIEMD